LNSTPLLAEIIGPDILIILAIVLLLFGGSRLPKLARSLGAAKKEFEHGLSEGASGAVPDAAPPQNGSVTLTQAEPDAMPAEREAEGRSAG
jgi:sec-independent protein translocase protein TatA